MTTEEVATISHNHNLGKSTKAALALVPHLTQGAQTLFCLILAVGKVCTNSCDVIDVGESYAV